MSKAVKFTDSFISSLKPRASRYEKWEAGRKGFGVRVAPSGKKSWIYLYRDATRRNRRMTLGTYPGVSLADAHVLHADAEKVLQGEKDPGALAVAKKRGERLAETFTELSEDYMKRHAEPKKRSASEDQRNLEQNVLPYIGALKAKEVTRQHVSSILDRIADRGAPIMANRVLALVRKVFNYGVSKGIVDHNPCLGVERPGVERQRDKVLSDDEIKTFWNGLDTIKITKGVALALRFSLVTAQRRGEVATIRLDEINFEKALWTIPAEKAKNGEKHIVPLSPLAVSLLKEAAKEEAKNRPKRRTEASEYVFPSRCFDMAINPHALTRAVGRHRDTLGAGINPHDLRRTAASNMAEMGIHRLHISKVLNHADPSVTAVYDRHSYIPEKTHALEAWAEHLEGILTKKKKSSNVVALKAG